jgi:hypothetical protein
MMHGGTDKVLVTGIGNGKGQRVDGQVLVRLGDNIDFANKLGGNAMSLLSLLILLFLSVVDEIFDSLMLLLLRVIVVANRLLQQKNRNSQKDNEKDVVAGLLSIGMV